MIDTQTEPIRIDLGLLETRATGPRITLKAVFVNQYYILRSSYIQNSGKNASKSKLEHCRMAGLRDRHTDGPISLYLFEDHFQLFSPFCQDLPLLLVQRAVQLGKPRPEIGRNPIDPAGTPSLYTSTLTWCVALCPKHGSVLVLLSHTIPSNLVSGVRTQFSTSTCLINVTSFIFGQRI